MHAKDADLNKELGQTFLVESLAQTKEMMQIFAQMLQDTLSENDDQQVLRVGFIGSKHNIGKSTFIGAIHDALDAGDVLERNNPSKRHEQKVSQSESVGLIRHYDSMLPAKFHLAAYRDPAFWDKNEMGIDLSENAVADKNPDFDFMLEIDREIYGDRRPDAPRLVTIFADEKHHGRPEFEAFMARMEEAFSMDRGDRPDMDEGAVINASSSNSSLGHD